MKIKSRELQMKHNYTMVRRLKLTNLAIDALNAKRLKQKESGIEYSDISNLLLYLIDALEA